MDQRRENAIRERAYQIWLDEGQMDGAHEDHWRRAEAEMETDTDDVVLGPEAPQAGLKGAGKAGPKPIIHE